MVSKNGWSVGGGWLKSIPGMLSLGHGLSVILSQLSRFEEALLRPKRWSWSGDSILNSNYARNLQWLGCHAEAQAYFDKALELGETEDRL
ncbi:MAG: tetratricopeptide repeat protein [Candidatus Competibacteraceae bacterium]